MRRHLLPSVLALTLATAGALATAFVAARPAGAQELTIYPTSAQRTAHSRIFIYDSYWRDSFGYQDDRSNSSATGHWEETAETSGGGTYQYAEGNAFHYSDINTPGMWWGDGIYAEIWTYSNAIDYWNGVATSENSGTLHVAFTTDRRMRVNYYWELGAWGTAPDHDVSGLISLSEQGGDDIFLYTFDDFWGDNAPFYTYLQPGAYEVDGAASSEVTASQYADYRDPLEYANSYILLWLRVFCVADYDTDMDVDTDDYDAFEAGFISEAPDTDVNGDGVIDGEDWDAYVEAYDDGC
jgi:hypothetical protein